MPLRVLHVLDHSMPTMSGYTVRSHDIVTAQAYLGMSPVILTGPLHQVDDPTAKDIVIEGVQYLRTPVSEPMVRFLRQRWPLGREIATVRLFEKQISKVLQETPYDIIHAHSPSLCGLAALRAARRARIPLVYEIRAFWEDAAVDQNKATPESLRYKLSRGLEQHVCEGASAVVGIASHIVSELKKRGLPEDKVFHVSNGVNTNRFVPPTRDEGLARELGLKDDVVFGFVGSVYRYEGLAWAVEAAAELHQELPKFQMIIIGAGEDKAAIERAVAKSNAESYVHVLGPVPHDDVKRYYSVMDVMMYPRRRVRLTDLVTPLKPLEAMAQARVVLGSNVGGIAELVTHEQTGLLFEADNPVDFRKQMSRLITNAALRAKLAHDGRAYVEREKDWRILARRYSTIYEYAIGRQVEVLQRSASQTAS